LIPINCLARGGTGLYVDVDVIGVSSFDNGIETPQREAFSLEEKRKYARFYTELYWTVNQRRRE